MRQEKISPYPIDKIISGGQTGADRAALDFAIARSIPYGGWLPKGRKTEDGALDPKYRLREMPTTDYAKRTEQNVLDADGTVIISHGFPVAGSALTLEFARRHNKPCLPIDLKEMSPKKASEALVFWLAENGIRVLNVAGPRAGRDPAIYPAVKNLLAQSIAGGRPVDVVLFDFGGVLAEEGWKEGLQVIARANGLNAAKLLLVAADTVYETGYILGKGSEISYWDAMRRKTGLQGDYAQLRDEILSRFIVRERMIDLVKRLKSDNLVVGILSDQTDMLDTLNDRMNFFQWFDHVFNSYHMGKGKRDATLFDDIAGLLKTPPERILFIDDDPGNVERARQRGWKAILYSEENFLQSELSRLLGDNPAPFALIDPARAGAGMDKEREGGLQKTPDAP